MTEMATRCSGTELHLRACPVCGLALGPGGAGARCPNWWCRRDDRAFSVVFSAAVHSGALRHAILRYKHRQELWWAPVFARIVARYLECEAVWFEEFDVMTGVPAYLGPGARRSWDPVGVLLGELARVLGPSWEIVEGLVEKAAETPAMQRLGWVQRRAVATGPLRRSLRVAAPEVAAGARVLVFDDVLTEGSTLHEVAAALRRAGASEVAGLVLARPVWSPSLSPIRTRDA